MSVFTITFELQFGSNIADLILGIHEEMVKILLFTTFLVVI
jgi:hypothetical protein